MKSKEKLSSMKSVRFDGIYTGKEAEVGHGGGGCVHIYIYICMLCNETHTRLVQCDTSWYSSTEQYTNDGAHTQARWSVT